MMRLMGFMLFGWGSDLRAPSGAVGTATTGGARTKLFTLANLFGSRVLQVYQRILVRAGSPFRSVSVRGCRIELDLRSVYDFRLWLLLKSGRLYEPATSTTIFRSLNPGDTFVDVGAHIGYFSILASPLVGASGRVYSFEPQPQAFHRLETNISSNKLLNVTAMRVALTAHAGEATIRIPLGDTGGATLVPRAVPGSTAEVSTRRGDSILPTGLHGVLKIDIEGSELEALRGLESVVSSSPDLHLMMEWNRTYAGEELWRWVSDRYHISLIASGRNSAPILITVDKSKQLPPQCNLWCTPKVGEVRTRDLGALRT